MSKVTVALLQMRITPNREENLARAREMIADAARRGAQVICLPELFLGPYFCQVEDAGLFDLAEPIPGPTTESLGLLARELGVAVVASIFERRAAGIYHNSLVVLDERGQPAGLYRKMHIPDDPAFYEKFYFTPGDCGFQVIPSRHARLGLLVCWDQWFPEAARLTALKGAEILFYPTAIGWHPHEKAELGERQRESWITVQRGHAVANGLFVVAVNRVGLELPAHGDGAGLEFWGSSFVAGPSGQVLAQASIDREEVLVVELDLGEIETTRRGWPFFRDRRIDAYQGLLARFGDAT
ncbi:MAG: carbon-nitrogen hydrolase [Planctomycetota bacterium]